jgi:hypothetical protein
MERSEKRLDRQQIHEVRLVVDRFIQALECQIEISYPDCCETFCQGSDVLPGGELMQSRDTFLSFRKVACLSMGCSNQADIQW